MLIQHGVHFKVTASCCSLPQRQYFEDLLNENWGVVSYYKNLHLRQNYKKTMLSWKTSEGAQKELKSLRVDGNPRKQKHVGICKQPFPASSLPVSCRSRENFPTI